MLEEELVLEGVASETLRCLSSGLLKASPAPLSNLHCSRSILVIWTREGLGSNPRPLDFLLLPGPEVMGQHAEVGAGAVTQMISSRRRPQPTGAPTTIGGCRKR